MADNLTLLAVLAVVGASEGEAHVAECPVMLEPLK